jgi:LuxR family maltose regulon positive regulatory protein
MTSPLLATKLYIPPLRPELVSRPHLIERLNSGLHRKLTLISAPAGFGKTTLVSEWINQSPNPNPTPLSSGDYGTQSPNFAWISLDKGDNDFARFVTHLIAALQRVKPGLGETVLAVFQSPQLPPVEAVLASLVNEIAAAGAERLALVLDDYHVIQSSTNQAVGFLLERLPPQLHLVIVTRRDPPLPLARLRARGQMTEIRGGDLQFTGEEAALFLKQAMGLALTPGEIALLENRTEGWIAGLQLAALALQGTSPLQNQAEFIRAFSGDDRYVIDYLVSEVLSGQPEEVQRFLLQTAVLERLCGPLCDAVNEARGDGQRLLEYLDQANLFLVPLDNRREWYRYHHLFGDVLLRRLRLAEPGQIPELHRRASAWYEDEGNHDDAIRHALDAQDLQGAARLVEQNALRLLIHSELTTLIKWLDALPDNLIRSRPWLCVYSAWAQLIIGQVKAAQLRLQAAQRLSHLAEPDLLGHIAVIRARIALAGQDLSRAVKLACQALEYVPERSPVHGHIAVIQGQAALMRGDLAAASAALTEAVSIAQDCEHLFMVVDATTMLGYLQTLQGRLRQALKTYQEALRLADVRGHKLPVAGNAHICMALALRERNELDSAARHLAQGLELCALFGNLRSGYLALAYLRQAGGDWDGALRAVQEAERQDPGPAVTFDILEVERCRLWLALVRGGPAASSAAAGWVRESGLSPLALSAPAEAPDDELTFGREPEHILLARALIALNRPAEATRLLGRLFLAAKAGGRVGRVIEILVLRALAFQAQGDATQALACLERALSLAEPEGYVRLFVDEGQAMMKLLRQAAARGIGAAHARKLVAAFATPTRETPTQTLVDPLSERELEVLRLLATNLSSTDIAQELTIAVSTVRSHTKSIYSKLNVHRRLDAVERAKELQLI